MCLSNKSSLVGGERWRFWRLLFSSFCENYVFFKGVCVALPHPAVRMSVGHIHTVCVVEPDCFKGAVLVVDISHCVCVLRRVVKGESCVSHQGARFLTVTVYKAYSPSLNRPFKSLLIFLSECLPRCVLVPDTKPYSSFVMNFTGAVADICRYCPEWSD